MTSLKPKIVGYGLCGKGEADKYLELSLKEFERMCDETIILLNNAGEKEKKLIEKYGFQTVEDDREWGKLQWKIKEDFVKNHVSKLNPDICVCIDMDEQFDTHLTKEKLVALFEKPFDAYAFHIIDLWDDGYLPELSFWNIRAWRWKPSKGLNFARKPVHCGLAPEWTWSQHYFAPYLLKHYGLKEKTVRHAKAERYKKYDPEGKWLSLQAGYYQLLSSNRGGEPFDEEAKHQEVVDFVINTNQKYIAMNEKEKEEYSYIKLKNGSVVPVPKAKLRDYLNQGLEYVGDVKDIMEELDSILEEETIQEVPQLAEYKCDQCDYTTEHKRSLHAHKIGKHRK